jgi:hypothetical protein
MQVLAVDHVTNGHASEDALMQHLSESRQGYSQRAAYLRAAAAAGAAGRIQEHGLHPHKQVEVVVQPACHTTRMPLTVRAEGLAAGAAPAAASSSAGGASSSSSGAAAGASRMTAYKVPGGGSSIMNLLPPGNEHSHWDYGSVQLAGKPDVLYASKGRADAAADAAGVTAVPVQLEPSKGVQLLPDFNPGSPFLSSAVRAGSYH